MRGCPRRIMGVVKAGSARKSVCVRAQASDNAKCGVAAPAVCALLFGVGVGVWREAVSANGMRLIIAGLPCACTGASQAYDSATVSMARRVAQPGRAAQPGRFGVRCIKHK